jgi:hypothetical protein
MTVERADDGTIRLRGDCPTEDADLLLSHLLADPEAEINWESCQSAHTSVVQILLARGRRPTGQPAGTFLKTMIGPAFDRKRR